MPPIIPSRTYQPPTTEPIYDDATSMAGPVDAGARPGNTHPTARHRDTDPALNYSQIEFLKNPGGARRFEIKEAAARPGPSESIYSTVDCALTAELAKSPEMYKAHQQLAKEVQEVVVQFATSNKAGARNWLFAPKEAYGSGAAATALASRLNGDRFGECADAYYAAVRGRGGKISPGELAPLVGTLASAETLQAISQLSPKQTAILAKHLRDPDAVEAAVVATEPERSSLACSHARGGVLRAMKDFVAKDAAWGAAPALS